MVILTTNYNEFLNLPLNFHESLFSRLDCEDKKKLAITSKKMNEIFRSQVVAGHTLSSKFIYVDDRYFSWTLHPVSLCANYITSLTLMAGSLCKNVTPKTSQKNIISILEIATKIRELYVHYFFELELEELPPLLELEKLEIYTIHNCTDLSVLSKYPKLTSLALQNSFFYTGPKGSVFRNLNFSPLKALTQISELDISYHLRIDLSTLPRLSHITKLRFSRNYCENLEDLTFIEKFPNLRILIWGQVADTIDVLLRTHTRLHTLDLTECFSFITGNPKIYVPLLNKINIYNPYIEYVMPICEYIDYEELEELACPAYTDIPTTLSCSIISGSKDVSTPSTYLDEKENITSFSQVNGKRFSKVSSPINKRVLTIVDPSEAHHMLHLKNN